MAKPDKQESIKGLKPGRWKPGESGNPKGRPAFKHTLTSLIRDELTKLSPDGRTYEQLLAEAIVKGAIAKANSGDGRLAELVLERVEGKVSQSITGEGGGPVEILVKYDGNG